MDCSNIANGLEFQCKQKCELSGWAAESNGGTGINISIECTVRHCPAIGNKGVGFTSNDNCTFKDCSAIGNTNSGIFASSASTVSDCFVQGNSGDGIRVGDRCTVLGNSCDSNGTGSTLAGIHATGIGNRIEGDHATGKNSRGIKVDAASNLIVKNSGLGNTFTNFDTAPGNILGPVINNVTVSTNCNPQANYSL